MELAKDQKYEIIGKIENINQGQNFSNTSITDKNKEHFNIKLDFEHLKQIEVGRVYRFETQAVSKNEEEIVLKCLNIEPIETLFSGQELIDIYDQFYRFAPLPITQIKDGVEAYLSKIENRVLKQITENIYLKNKDRFYSHPAATKFHHAYVGGLSYHTLSMLNLIEPFIKAYPYLNRDLLYAGTILHDMSKINEISGVDGEYTAEGQLLGHLVMQTAEIEKVADQLGTANTEEALLLKHMIISHHGIPNFGSPKKPQIGEALLLWYLDTIDSKFTELETALAETKEGQFTTPIAVLDKMKFYKASIKK